MTERQTEVVRWTIVTLLMVGLVLFLTCLPGSARADQGVIYAPVGVRVVLFAEVSKPSKPAEKNAVSATTVAAVKTTAVKKARRREDTARDLATPPGTTDAAQDRRMDRVESTVDRLTARASDAQTAADRLRTGLEANTRTDLEAHTRADQAIARLAQSVDTADYARGLLGWSNQGVHALAGLGMAGNRAGAAGGPMLIVGFGRPIGIELGVAYGYSGSVDGERVWQTDGFAHLTLAPVAHGSGSRFLFLFGARYEHRAAPNSTNWWGGEGGLRYYMTEEVAVQGTIALGRLFVDQNQSEVAPGGSLSALVNF